MLWPKHTCAMGLAAVMMWLSTLAVYEANPLALMGLREEDRMVGVEVLNSVCWGGTLCLVMVGLIALVSFVFP